MNNPPEGEAFHVMEFIMLKQFLYGAAALMIVGGVAYAENNAVNPAPAAPADTQAANSDGNPPPPPGDGQGWWGRMGHRHGGRHMQGMMGQGGPDGPGMMGQGGRGPMGGPGMMAAMMDHQMFHLQLGNGIEVHVNCGKAEMKDCIASAQPLIDAAKAAAVAQPQTKAQ
ncbi:MAG: hypothetical protein ABJA10_05365 [Aestuariivirga sp.]